MTEKETLKQPDKGCAVLEILLHVPCTKESIEMDAEDLLLMKSVISVEIMQYFISPLVKLTASFNSLIVMDAEDLIPMNSVKSAFHAKTTTSEAALNSDQQGLLVDLMFFQEISNKP